MTRQLTKIAVPLLLTALAVAVYFEFGSVETIDLDSRSARPPEASAPETVSPSRSAPAATSRLAPGQRFGALAQLERDQKAAGFVRIGLFGKHWPARVTEIATDRDGITFVKGDGVQHSYTGFAGYNLKMVRLQDGGRRETIVVFRSADKQ